VRPGAVYYFDDTASFGRSLARHLNAAARRVSVHVFPDGESRVRVQPGTTRSVVLTRRLDDPNAKLFEILLAADALRRAGVRRIALVAPYLPYMRQDRVFAPGGAVSQQVLARMISGAVDDMVTLEPHLHRIADLREVFDCETRSLPSAPLLAHWCERGRAATLVVGPDEESEPWVRSIADEADLPWVVGQKRRRGDRSVRIRLPELPAARRAVIVDDIASTGATLAEAARVLRRRGIDRVEAAVVHAIFAPGATAALSRAGVDRVISCDTVLHETNAIATAPYFAAAILSSQRSARDNRGGG
jgi:ribose-phosphate pyrophosphokinase